MQKSSWISFFLYEYWYNASSEGDWIMRRWTRLAFFMAVEASYAGLGYRADRLEANED
jgi:hypothetical protein